MEQVLPILKPYKLVSREISPDPTVIEARGRKIGDGWFGLIAGPCTVETRGADAGDRPRSGGRRSDDAARRCVQAADVPVRLPGARRGGARDPPRGARETGLPIVTELLDPRQLDEVADVADVIQIGARNMQNFLLLAELGRVDRARAAQARPRRRPSRSC